MAYAKLVVIRSFKSYILRSFLLLLMFGQCATAAPLLEFRRTHLDDHVISAQYIDEYVVHPPGASLEYWSKFYTMQLSRPIFPYYSFYADYDDSPSKCREKFGKQHRADLEKRYKSQSSTDQEKAAYREELHDIITWDDHMSMLAMYGYDIVGAEASRLAKSSSETGRQYQFSPGEERKLFRSLFPKTPGFIAAAKAMASDLSKCDARLASEQIRRFVKEFGARKAPSKPLGAKKTGALESMSRLSANEIDKLRSDISRCINLPTGAESELKDMPAVTLTINLSKDGKVSSIDIPPGDAESRSGLGKYVVEAVRRGVVRCAPYDLPKDKYDAWKVIVLNFTPESMF